MTLFEPFPSLEDKLSACVVIPEVVKQRPIDTHVTKGQCTHRVTLPPSEQQHEPKRCIPAGPLGRQRNNPRNYS